MTEATFDVIETGADVAVRTGAPADSILIARRLAPHRRLLVASPAYLAAPAPQEPADLREHECLLFALQPTGAWCRRPLGTRMAEPIAVAVSGRLRANDSEVLRDAALSDLGLALLPTRLIGDDIRAHRLVPVLPKWEWLIAPGPERAIWAIYPPKRVVPPKTRAFLDLLAERFAGTPFWEAD